MFENKPYVSGLVGAAVTLTVYLFIVIVCYFTLSTPVNMIYDSFEAADFAAAESYKDTLMPTIRLATTIFFSILLSIPLTWFFFWVFHREPTFQSFDTFDKKFKY